MFLAHTNDIKPNWYKPISQLKNSKVIVNSDDYKLISNICPHQNSLISANAGNGSRVCPFHSWSFDIDGNPLTSGRTAYYCKNQNQLESFPLYKWNSMLFTNQVLLESDIDFKNLELVEERIDKVDADFKIIMDIFLDVDHIQSVHPGVYDMIGITNTEVKWKFYDSASIQYVDQGAVWIAIYPYTMIEWQKGSVFVTTSVPTQHNTTNVHVFKYFDRNFKNQWKLNEYVWELSWKQDKSQAESISSFPEENIEPQKQHFRNYLKNNGIYEG